MLEAYRWSQYKLIGFTSVFQQNASSLAFARLLRERFPHVRILFGGANCEGEMGVALLDEHAPALLVRRPQKLAGRVQGEVAGRTARVDS